MTENNYTTMEDRLREDVLLLVRSYSGFLGINDKTAIRIVFGTSSYLNGILGTRNGGGGSFRVRSYDYAVAKFSNCWPSGLEWPAGIVRIPLDAVPPPQARSPAAHTETERTE